MILGARGLGGAAITRRCLARFAGEREMAADFFLRGGRAALRVQLERAINKGASGSQRVEAVVYGRAVTPGQASRLGPDFGEGSGSLKRLSSMGGLQCRLIARVVAASSANPASATVRMISVFPPGKGW